MDYPKSKVTELKEILTSRGLSTKGVKAELIARLEEDDAAPMAPAAPAQDEAEVEIPSTEPAKVDESAQVEESAAAPAVAPAPTSVSELSPRPHPEASELMKQTAQAEGVVETLEAQDEVEIQAEQEEGIGAETATKSEATAAPPSLTSRLSTQDGEKKPEQQEEGGPSMLSAIASAHSAGVEAIVPGESSASPLQAESAPASTSTSNPPRKAAKGSAPLSSLAPPHPPTRALRVTGLVRPMMLPSLKEMLREKFGELDESEEVKGGVWLDGIKSAGWIVFKEASSAQQLFETFNSKPFPSSDSFRTPVSFFYVPAEQVPRLLQEEEDFWEKERGRMDIVATTSQTAEDGGERKYEYSTRPVRQQKKIRDPKPPPPSATAAHSISGAAAGGQGLSIRGSGFNKRAGAAANGAGASPVADLPMDASSLPPVSFPPVRSPKQDRSRDEGRGRGSRAEGRYQPYPPPGDRDVAPAPIADPYAKATSPSSVGPLRDAQTELEISRSRDAAASAYAGRGGRGPSGPPSAAYDSRRDDYASARGGYGSVR
ncbi:hypothetical protein BCV69DRAFT_64705 [Microstroma glucosiphilum]|uniref:SAP domain-containing protein n=1 Tax=Pseudomicrostroma glucosiphilum TaxID=1684307 RepID=A0A316U0X1_9BASI|nr:hypothetical protein BCV69DRAFT_64705 [Pseudomicrostroma glucosiphilum]PWN18850.1 hypothetical protein BCV69DRAFT_64705 [Pseudomicrostroma glucosiphilum]